MMGVTVFFIGLALMEALSRQAGFALLLGLVGTGHLQCADDVRADAVREVLERTAAGRELVLCADELEEAIHGRKS